MAGKPRHPDSVVADALRRHHGVIAYVERELGVDLGHRIARRPELRALTAARQPRPVVPWTHPRSPWMAGVGIELEQYETGGIGAGWSRMSKTGRAA